MRYFFVLIGLKSGKKAAILIIYINKLQKLMTLWKSPETIFLRDWQLCRMNKKSRSSPLIIPLRIQ